MQKIGSKNGFTVLELIIVISIVGILVAIASLSFSDYWRRSTVKEAARLIDGDLMNIRAAVKSRQQVAIMNITPTGYTAFIDIDNDNVFNSVVDTTILTRTFNAPLQLQGVGTFAVPGTISFSELGKIVTNISFRISMTTDPNRQYCISIVTTGLTRVTRTETGAAPPCTVPPWTSAW
jgi:prepilin-type N-terminal cleavage/methylation domain-containing protein